MSSVRRKGAFRLQGQDIFTPKNSVIFRRILADGDFEPEISAVLSALAKPNSTVFDVGANIGVMSAKLLSARSDINVVAVECSPSALPYLRRTMQGSPHRCRWKVAEAAASHTDGSCSFFTSGPDLGAYDGVVDTGRGGTAAEISVVAKRLDSIWGEIGRPPVSLVKLDIEGGEWDALQGAQELVEICRPYFVIEWNAVNLKANGREVEDIFKIFPDKYDLFSLPWLTKVEPALIALETARSEMFLLAPKRLNFDALPHSR